MNNLLSISDNNGIVIDDERVSDKNSNNGTSQQTATDNDSVVLIDLEDPDENTNMNNLPSGIDNDKQNNTGGTLVNDSFMKHSITPINQLIMLMNQSFKTH